MLPFLWPSLSLGGVVRTVMTQLQSAFKPVSKWMWLVDCLLQITHRQLVLVQVLADPWKICVLFTCFAIEPTLPTTKSLSKKYGKKLCFSHDFDPFLDLFCCWRSILEHTVLKCKIIPNCMLCHPNLKLDTQLARFHYRPCFPGICCYSGSKG